MSDLQPTVVVNGLVKTEDRDREVLEAHRTEGFVTRDGKIDKGARAGRIVELLLGKAVASNLKERQRIAITKGDLVSAVFPSATGPEDFDNEPDPALAQATWEQLERSVWGDVRTDPMGQAQRMLANGVSNGDQPFVLLRTKITASRVDAVYITRDIGCILKDGAEGLAEHERRAMNRDALQVRLWMERIPEAAERLAKTYRRHGKMALESGQNIIQLQLEAMKSDEAEAPEAETTEAQAPAEPVQA